MLEWLVFWCFMLLIISLWVKIRRVATERLTWTSCLIHGQLFLDLWQTECHFWVFHCLCPSLFLSMLETHPFSILFFWIVTPCGLVDRYQRFGETYCLHIWGWRRWQYVYPKCWYVPTSLHGVTTQMNIIDIFTGVKTSIFSSAVFLIIGTGGIGDLRSEYRENQSAATSLHQKQTFCNSVKCVWKQTCVENDGASIWKIKKYAYMCSFWHLNGITFLYSLEETKIFWRIILSSLKLFLAKQRR
jgi:hypothetical protein